METDVHEISDCPHAAQATSYVARTLDDQEADAFEKHYFSCDSCWNEVQRGLEVRSGFGMPATKTRTLPRWLPLAAAAGLAGVALVGTFWLRPPASVEPVQRDAQPSETTVRVRTELTNGRLVARWEAVAGADRYVVSLVDAEGNGLLERQIRETEIHIERDTLSPSLAPDAALFWRVQAQDELLRVLADSGPVRAGPAPRGRP